MKSDRIFTGKKKIREDEEDVGKSGPVKKDVKGRI